MCIQLVTSPLLQKKGHCISSWIIVMVVSDGVGRSKYMIALYCITERAIFT